MMLAISEGLGAALYIGGTLLSAAAGSYSAVKSQETGKKARRMQQGANQRAEAMAGRNESRAAADLAKARKRQEQMDLASILSSATSSRRPETLLTNPSGIPTTASFGGVV